MPMAGRAAVISAACRAERARRRWEAQEKHAQMKGFITQMLEKYDTDNLGCLNRFQIVEVLKELNSGKAPTSEELDYIMTVASRETDQGTDQGSDEGMRTAHSKRVYRHQLMAALDAWKTYKDNESTINEYFERYDVNKSGSLEHKQLCQLLTDLDCGKRPSETEVNYILYSADLKNRSQNRAINRPELMYAIGLWYALVAEERERLQAEEEVCVIA